MMRCALWLLLLCAAVPLVPLGGAAEVTQVDRESAYPPEVANVTQDPWRPRAGQDVRVSVRLADDAPLPAAATLLFCRVEPEYVCGLPFFLDAYDGGRSWRGTIEWNGDFMKSDTRHVGYNVTLRYDEDGRRVHAPVGNYWLPESYPEGADGVYFFYEIGPQAAASPLPLWVALLAFALVLPGRARRGA